MRARFLRVLVGAGAVLVMVGLPGASVQAGVADPWGILNFTANPTNPVTGLPWAVGDKIRFAFVTTGTHNAVSGDIEVYNSFVTAQANSVGSKVNGKSTAWKVVGGTSTVAGIDNTGSRGSSNGIPIFLLDTNTSRLTTDGGTFWNSGWRRAFNVDQTGATVPGDVLVFTGTGWGGEILAPNPEPSYGPLGNPGGGGKASMGMGIRYDNGDRYAANHSTLDTLHRLYAVSEVITLVSDAPATPAGTTFIVR